MVSTPSLDQPVAIISGVTASGKTAIALELARKYHLEIINADSLLVYKDLSIGTAKPSVSELNSVPHHLVNICKLEESFTAGDFVREASRVLLDLQKSKRRALVVGGTGFYLKALIYGMWDSPKSDDELRKRLEQLSSDELYTKLFKIDEPSALRVGKQDRYRLLRSLEIYELIGQTPTELEKNKKSHPPNPNFHLFLLDRESQELENRIEERTKKMISEGIIEEYSAARKLSPESRALTSVGYAQVETYLSEIPVQGRKIQPGVSGLISEICLATRQLVKAQRTFFKGQLLKDSRAQEILLDQDREKLFQAVEKIYG